MARCGRASLRLLGLTKELLQLLGTRAPDAAESAIVGQETRIRIPGPFTLAETGAAHIGAGFPGTAADDTFDIFAWTRRAVRIGGRAFFVIARAVEVLGT